MDEELVAGDIVTFEHKDGSRLVREVYGSPNRYIDLEGYEVNTHQLLLGGWRVSSVRHFQVPLPTSPGSVISWRDGAYLPQIALLDPNARNLGWRHQKDEDARWCTPDEMAAEIAGHRWTLLGIVS